MPQQGSPTIRRWELATRLREMREARNLTLDEVATKMLCSPSKISRIETAARGASLRDVRDLCGIYGVGQVEQDRLMELVRLSKEVGWWQKYDEALKHSGSATFIGLEDVATSIQHYETARLPGLLQTAEYTRALMRRNYPSLSGEAVQQYVDSREARFQQVLRSSAPPNYWVILDEAALARRVGGAAVMKKQIEFLLACVDSRLVTVQVVGFEAGAHAGMESSFEILNFADGTPPDVVYVEGRWGSLFLNRPNELVMFRETFDHLRAVASSADDSVITMERLRDALAS